MSDRQTLKDNEAKWRTGGEGRLDILGRRWWSCDPYPCWYRYEDGILYTPSPLPADHVVYQRPTWDNDD